MPATADFVNPYFSALEPEEVINSEWTIARGAKRLLGAVLTMFALGLWIAPNSNWDADIIWFKVGLSLAAMIAGMLLTIPGATPTTPRVEIDTVRREIRLVRTLKKGRTDVLQRCGFADLTRVDRAGGHICLWGEGDVLLAEVILTDYNALSSLVAGLRDAGKIS